jgi:hypothetical protein
VSLTTPPHSPEAETALISRLLIEPDHLSEFTLHADDFYSDDARLIFKAMVDLRNEHERIDIVTIRNQVGRDVDIDLFTLTPAHRAPVTAYAEIIKTDAWRRRYIDELAELIRQARRNNDPQELISALEERAEKLAEGIGPDDILGRQNLAEHQGELPPPLFDILSPHGTTVIYGDGGDGKGWVAAKLASQMIQAGTPVGILDFEMQPQEWAHRLGKFGVSIDDVPYFSPPTTMDKWATEQSARMLRQEGVQYLLIDSAMYAADVEDPYSPNGALAYGRARRRLNNLPALLLAHTTGGADKVFGSVFWRNESRIVWRLNKDRQTFRRHLECRKANGYPELEGRKYQIEYDGTRGILNLHEHGKPWAAEAVA